MPVRDFFTAAPFWGLRPQVFPTGRIARPAGSRRFKFQQLPGHPPSAARGDFDIGLSGIEDTPARRARLAVTIPYYQFREVLTVRAADRDRFRMLADLRGRRVATLSATLAYNLLVAAQDEHGIVPVTYEDDVHPYSDLALGPRRRGGAR